MKKIKISEAQAKMLKGINEAKPNNKVLKISESQYQKILDMEKASITNEDVIAGKQISKPNLPSNKVTKGFSSGFSPSVKKEMGKLYEQFLREVYNLNENSESKFGKLISLMEVAGFIENSRIKKEKFNGDREKVKNIIQTAIKEVKCGLSEYNIVEEHGKDG